MKVKKKAKGHRLNNLVLVITAVTVAILIYTLFNTRLNAPSVQFGTKIVRPGDPLQIIKGKTSMVRVPSRFSPVLIFNIIGRGPGNFTGSGSLFIGSHGKQIATTEHLFPRSGGVGAYGYQLLGATDNYMFGIEKVLYTGKEITGDATDLVILSVGTPKLIQGFSVHDIEAHTGNVKVTALKGAPELTSLVSGEKVRILGKAEDVVNKIEYFIVDYKSISGESGTGLVDRDDNLYVLKSSVASDLDQEVSRLLGYTKGITYVCGPLKFR